MHLLVRLGLLGLHTAWASTGVVEALSDYSVTEPAPDGHGHGYGHGQPPSVDDVAGVPSRRPESPPQRLPQHRKPVVGNAAAGEGLVSANLLTHVGAGDDSVSDDLGQQSEEWGEEEWEEGKWEERAEETERRRGGERGHREVLLESRALFGFPWTVGRAKEQETPGTGPDTPMVSRLRSGEANTNSSEEYASLWKGAGGVFGLSADWQEAISLPDQGEVGPEARHMSLRGEACMTEEKRFEVQAILDKRRTAPSTKNVAVCVRTKDYGRFLPEWIAFHYAAGVDDITVYDDDSLDNTKEILQPFVEAGIVRYISGKIEGRAFQMRPLNHCLKYHQRQRQKPGGILAPRWVVFHDTDEYLLPLDTDLTILQALDHHQEACCLLVKRLQFGSGGHDETPRGLMLEEFLMHNGFTGGNGNAKVVVNLDPTQPELGTVQPPLKSMHNAEGCKCHGQEDNGVSDLRINHYLGSIGDYMDRTVRYWEEKRSGENTAEKTVLKRDTNYIRSEEILHWACATREILYRVVEGLDLDEDLAGPE
eukprot:g7539.t1